MEDQRPLQSISDDELLRRLAELMGQSRRVESDLVAHICEVDERKLYAREACPSMFAYCTNVLHLAEAEAYLRIAAARVSREHPMVLTMLREGRLHLTGTSRAPSSRSPIHPEHWPLDSVQTKLRHPSGNSVRTESPFPENIRLMCSAHNRYLAEQDYGIRKMARYRRSGESNVGASGFKPLASSEALTPDPARGLDDQKTGAH